MDLETKPRRQTFDPKSKYDFCLAFSKITGRPLGLFLSSTKAWPITWFFQVQSECKEKDKTTQAKIINMWVREGRIK